MELDLAGLQMPGLPEQVRDGQVVLRPLERGFGHTLGNTVRRILLSSLRGTAVWAFRADTVLHEHQTIPGVVEDVHQVIRNLKALVLRMDEDVNEAVLELRADGAGSVTARNIRAHPSVEVINPDHHILELQDDRDLRLELHVNKGRGFVLAEQHPLVRGMPADLVRIDSIYNPVVRANFVVEETRVGQRTDFDRLVMEVETNGSIGVAAAVQYAAKLAIEHFSYLAGGRPEWTADRPWGADGSDFSYSRSGRNLVPPRIRDLLGRQIEDVTELGVRSRNSLQKEEIQTVRNLVERSEAEMLKIENFGKKSLQEISDFLNEQGLHFGMKFQEGADGALWWAPEEGEVQSSDPEPPTEEETQS